MMANERLYCGVDVGTSATKVVIMDAEGRLEGWCVERTGAEAENVATHCRDTILGELNLSAADVAVTGSTGYARDDVGFADFTRTEISCHSRGCLHYFAGPFTIVDIGGQDNKIIKLNEEGKRVGFKLNRKCAAGTGSFLEEIANLLNVPIEDLNALAEQAEKPVKLGSFCTVFTKTEILSNFRRGDRVPDIVAGAFESVVRRIIEMDPLDGDIVLTGGVVAHNPCIVGVFERTLGRPMRVPLHPQLTGALGAALLAMESEPRTA
jgi:predicted CoA-substrate-specific enzyme activase